MILEPGTKVKTRDGREGTVRGRSKYGTAVVEFDGPKETPMELEDGSLLWPTQEWPDNCLIVLK